MTFSTTCWQAESQKKCCAENRTAFHKGLFSSVASATKNRKNRAGLFRHHFYGLQTLLPLFDFKGNCLPIAQRLEPAGLDRAEVHENITVLSALDKTESLFVVEPLHFSLWHNTVS